jgi:YfiH family protein
MVIIRSSILSKFPEIIFGFSTRIGAKRKPPYYFNLSFSVGDKKNIVEENRRIFLRSLGLEDDQVVIQKQTHSDIVRYVEKPGDKFESDALITDKTNLGLAVNAADCTPIFLYDKKNRIISAVHSGWRGTRKKILFKTLDKIASDFGSKADNIIAYIGPSIKQANYEVGKEVAVLFSEKYFLKENGKYFLDVSAANYDMLINFGIKKENIEISSLCTYENFYLLHSFRRDGAYSGRSMGIIALRQINEK